MLGLEQVKVTRPTVVTGSKTLPLYLRALLNIPVSPVAGAGKAAAPQLTVATRSPPPGASPRAARAGSTPTLRLALSKMLGRGRPRIWRVRSGWRVAVLIVSIA